MQLWPAARATEEEIRHAMAGQVVFRVDPGCKHQAGRIDPTRCGFLAQVFLGVVIVLQQPKHAALDGADDRRERLLGRLRLRRRS